MPPQEKVAMIKDPSFAYNFETNDTEQNIH